MNKMRFFGTFLLVATGAAQVSAYETYTHQALTKNAVSRSVLATDATVLSDLGLFPWNQGLYINSRGDAPMTAAEIVSFGSYWEDEDYMERALNHFFDPQFNLPAGRGLDYSLGPFSVTGHASPDWILEDRGDVIDNGGGRCAGGKGCSQRFSFKRGQQALYDSLTATNADQRAQAASLALQIVGHVSHHIQDMAQPQHTRNDQHLHPVPVLGGYPIWSNYEMRTKDNTDRIARMLDGLKLTSTEYPIPKLPTARHYWHSPAASTTRYLGMAEFTSNNYTSFGTQYTTQLGNPAVVLPAQGMPLPNGTVTRIARYATPAATSVEGTPIPAGESDFLVGNVHDGFTGRNVETKLAVPSLTYVYNGGVDGARAGFVENSLIWEAQYNILMPRAAAFSAGMVNHFFRGRLNLVKDANGNQWRVTNAGQDAMEGRFSIFTEDVWGVRTPIAGAEQRTALDAGQSFTLGFTPPPSTLKLIAVFTGRIGAEGDATLQSLFYAVAGKVIPYTAPAAPEIVNITRNPAPMVAGQNYTVSWTTKNADGFSYHCVPNGTGGMSASGTLTPGTSSIGGVASATWTSSPSTCTYTATGPGGTLKRVESNVTTVSATPPTIGCTAFSAAGANGVVEKIHELGSTPGIVQVNFDAFTIKDEFTITPEFSSTVLASSGVPISGVKTATFNHNPQDNGTKVKVRVVGNVDPSTAWGLAMACPGQAMPGVSAVDVQFVLLGARRSTDCTFSYTFEVNNVSRPFPGTTMRLSPAESHSYYLHIQNMFPSNSTCTMTQMPAYIDGGGTVSMGTDTITGFRVRSAPTVR